MAEGVLVFRVMLVGDELGSVIAVQSVFGGNPYHAVPGPDIFLLIRLLESSLSVVKICTIVRGTTKTEKEIV